MSTDAIKRATYTRLSLLTAVFLLLSIQTQVFVDGELVEEVNSITHLWPDAPLVPPPTAATSAAPEPAINSTADSAAATTTSTTARTDLVGFLLGCSFSFDGALAAAGLEPRHVSQERNVPMYRTSVPCTAAGPLTGNLVVSMRPYSEGDIPRVEEITGRFPRVHGAPIHWGDPTVIGIADLNKPLFGDAVKLCESDVPVFWACGATPQLVVMQARPPLCITHSPGHMLVCDVTNEELADSSCSSSSNSSAAG
jgi:uncharacterized protein YcsI (UPF0317 family)